MCRRRRRLVFTAVGLLIVLFVTGTLYENRAVSRDRARFAPPGSLFDVGGRRLHLFCIGQGSPTVFFEQSGFSNALSFEAARSTVAEHTRVCSYDRMGIGWSDPGPSEISAGMLADDMRRLQDAAALEPPFLVVASSIGGVSAEMFARRYPERVLGLVLVDAANSELIERMVDMVDGVTAQVACSIAVAAGRIGVLRMLDPWDMRNASSNEAERSAALLYGAKPWVMLCAMVAGRNRTLAEFKAAPALREDVPLTVLSAETREGLLPPGLERLGVDPDATLKIVRDSHQQLARRSMHGTWRIVPGSDHLIAASQPRAVSAAVLEMLGTLIAVQ